MRLPFRRGHEQPTGPRRESTERDEPQPPLYRTPTFRALMARLGGERTYNILDLQPAVGANVEYFSRFACRLQIVDFLAGLAADEVRPLLETDAGAAFRRVLPRSPEPFDVVLAWATFNYITRDQCRLLVEHLRGVSRTGALMLAFVATTKEIPERPPLFRIVDDQTLDWEPTTTATRLGPRFPPALVERLTPGFVVVHSVLMRQGVQEYLFERADGPATPR